MLLRKIKIKLLIVVTFLLPLSSIPFAAHAAPDLHEAMLNKSKDVLIAQLKNKHPRVAEMFQNMDIKKWSAIAGRLSTGNRAEVEAVVRELINEKSGEIAADLYEKGKEHLIGKKIFGGKTKQYIEFVEKHHSELIQMSRHIMNREYGKAGDILVARIKSELRSRLEAESKRFSMEVFKRAMDEILGNVVTDAGSIYLSVIRAELMAIEIFDKYSVEFYRTFQIRLPSGRVVERDLCHQYIIHRKHGWDPQQSFYDHIATGALSSPASIAAMTSKSGYFYGTIRKGKRPSDAAIIRELESCYIRSVYKKADVQREIKSAKIFVDRELFATAWAAMEKNRQEIITIIDRVDVKTNFDLVITAIDADTQKRLQNVSITIDGDTRTTRTGQVTAKMPYSMLSSSKAGNKLEVTATAGKYKPKTILVSYASLAKRLGQAKNTVQLQISLIPMERKTGDKNFDLHVTVLDKKSGSVIPDSKVTAGSETKTAKTGVAVFKRKYSLLDNTNHGKQLNISASAKGYEPKTESYNIGSLAAQLDKKANRLSVTIYLEEKKEKDKISFSSSSYVVNEDAGTAAITVKRTGSGKGRVLVQYSTRNGSATAGKQPGGGDYDPATGALHWPDGDTSAKVFHVFINADKIKEKDETVLLGLKLLDGNASIAPTSSATLVIRDVTPTPKGSIRIDKVPSNTSFKPGDTVTYYYTVSNTGKAALANVTVSDNTCKPVMSKGGDINGNGLLDTSELWIYECTQTLLKAGSISNTARVTALGPGGNTLSAIATVTVRVATTKIKVPYVLGLTREAAEYDIREARLKVGSVTEEWNDAPAGEVFFQFPKAGTLVIAGSNVNIRISKGAKKKVRTLYIDPPRTTIEVDQEAAFRALLIYDNNEEVDVTNIVRWSSSAENIAGMTGRGRFRGKEEGRTIIKAVHPSAIGLATLNVEEGESRTKWDKPISSSRDVGKKAVPAPADAFTWYALCEKNTGDVSYGEDINVARYRVLGGPFAGPRTAKQWIDQHYPSWRCPTSGVQGQWNVLCNKQNYTVAIGKTIDPTRYWIMQGGFISEKDARTWIGQNCPTWTCSQGGACAAGPRSGGDWAVVCSKEHGGIGLTKNPDPTRSWIFASGLREEKDARLWVELRCPSWRCNRDGQCMTGIPPRTERKPLELPPEFESPFSAGGEVDADSMARQRESAPPARDKGYEFGRRLGELLGKKLQDQYRQPAQPPASTRKPDTGVTWESNKKDCSAERKKFNDMANRMTEQAKKLNCEKGNHYSGCALDVVGPFFPYWPDRIFSDEACAKPGYIGCASGAFSGYVGCLDGCNSAWRSGGNRDLKGCGQKCYQQIEQAMKRCTAK